MWEEQETPVGSVSLISNRGKKTSVCRGKAYQARLSQGIGENSLHLGESNQRGKKSGRDRIIIHWAHNTAEVETRELRDIPFSNPEIKYMPKTYSKYGE